MKVTIAGARALGTHLAVERHDGPVARDREQRQHAAVHVVVEVAVEQPRAGVVGDHGQNLERAGLDRDLGVVGGLVVRKATSKRVRGQGGRGGGWGGEDCKSRVVAGTMSSHDPQS